MIPIIIVVSLAFLWLGYETDWLRVRLTGYEESNYPTKTWTELRPSKILRTDVMWLRYPDSVAPLCGWDWLNKTLHIMPDYSIELIGIGYKTTIHSADASALRDAMRVNRNPYIKIKLSY